MIRKAFWHYFQTYFLEMYKIQSLLEGLVIGALGTIVATGYRVICHSTICQYQLLEGGWSTYLFYSSVACVSIPILFLLRATWYAFRFYGYEVISSYFGYRGIRYTKQEQSDNNLYFNSFPCQEERIIASANLDDEGTMWSVMAPGRHHHAIAFMAQHGMNERITEQGFMTNHHRFINREDAFILAMSNKQCIGPVHEYRLFSEDLWDTPTEMTRLAYKKTKKKERTVAFSKSLSVRIISMNNATQLPVTEQEEEYFRSIAAGTVCGKDVKSLTPVTAEHIYNFEDLFEFIRHGDSGHQEWLYKALKCFFDGTPKPDYVASINDHKKDFVLLGWRIDWPDPSVGTIGNDRWCGIDDVVRKDRMVANGGVSVELWGRAD